MLYTALIVIHILLAIGLIAVVLVQRGPGATMGAAFGAGASGTVFGSKGSASFLGKLTGWVGVAFFLISLSMAVLLARSGGSGATVDDLGVAERLIEAPVEAPGEAPAPDGAGSSADEPEDAPNDAFLQPPVDGEQDAPQAGPAASGDQAGESTGGEQAGDDQPRDDDTPNPNP
jgi:preprotein translocase subunit SecG